MFEGLVEAVRDLEVPVDGAALRTLFWVRDRLDAKLSDAVAAFDDAKLFDVDAAVSTGDWLERYAHLTARDAASWVKVARRLRGCPATAAAWRDGRVTGGQVQALVAVLNDRRTVIYRQHEPALLGLLYGRSVRDSRDRLNRFRDLADALDDSPAPAEPERWVSLSRTLGQRGELRGSLDPVAATTVETALTLAQRADGDGESRTPGQRRADALVDVCAHYLNSHQADTNRRHRPHLELITSLDDLREHRPGITHDGIVIPFPDLASMACDSVLSRVVLAGGQLLDYGHHVRAVPLKLFFAVRARDHHCRWPDCDQPAQHCHAHHVTWWWHHGPTTIDNLALLCRRHHRRLHQPGHTAKLHPDATLDITLPDGRTITSHPPHSTNTLFDTS